jgi:hypothetical protein
MVVRGVFVGVGRRSWRLGGRVWEGVAVRSGVEWGGRLVLCVMLEERCCWADEFGTNGSVGRVFSPSLTCGSV